jgi:hypothetical protein
MQSEQKYNSPLTKTAQVISYLTNPLILSVLVMLLISLTKSREALTLAGRWVEVLIFLVLFPLIYLLIRAIFSKEKLMIPRGITIYLKQHPREVMVMSLIFGVPCLMVLMFFGAPVEMYCTLAALLVTAVIIASVYKFYRISYHIAATTILVVMVVINWGGVFAWLAVLIPAAGWAKYRLHEHSPAQMVIAASLSAVMVSITLWAAGLF